MNEMINPIPEFIEAIPEDWKAPAETEGKLEPLMYETWESDTYEQHLKRLTKRAMVYTPAGMKSEAEKRADPSKRNTGLFFFRGLPDSPFAIVSTGGGFVYVAALRDSFPECLELSRMGINGFAVIYRPGAQTACEDLSHAIQFIFENAAKLQVNTEGYSLWGGSAGGRMSAWVSEMGTAAFGCRPWPKPAADIIQYTGLTDVSRQDVPTWMIVGTNDAIAYYRTMEQRSERLNVLASKVKFMLFRDSSMDSDLVLERQLRAGSETLWLSG